VCGSIGSFDHFVGSHNHGLWHSEAERRARFSNVVIDISAEATPPTTSPPRRGQHRHINKNRHHRAGRLIRSSYNNGHHHELNVRRALVL